ncbi:hypothetical protein BAUCODRAFT_450384 [Baudoinia panamericana UAMH 10762]|uniref:Uncharacterized protein n=1 Tax=Baudoinia panamericana (strain UAMH 10762) TaxID=717646 RepID=M2NDU4_BAUPA|nr:uncharacterized protein BAUCODRAFT_450384 [Baudoinia panamericana UAMH 10762]EMC97389.1 hypothetical protein BAUCODRAFT_450384 [Baudoinia panamericana UAMH 10762]
MSREVFCAQVQGLGRWSCIPRSTALTQANLQGSRKSNPPLALWSFADRVYKAAWAQ